MLAECKRSQIINDRGGIYIVHCIDFLQSTKICHHDLIMKQSFYILLLTLLSVSLTDETQLQKIHGDSKDSNEIHDDTKDENEEYEEIYDLFRAYDKGIDPTGEIDPKIKSMLEDRNLRMLPSGGLIISNHQVDMTLVEDRLETLEDSYENLMKFAGEKSPHVTAVAIRKTEAENQLATNCYIGGLQKRFIISLPTVIISLAVSGGVAAATSLGVSYAFGEASDTKLSEEAIGVSEDLNANSAIVDSILENTLHRHGQQLKDHERRLYTIEASQRLKNKYTEVSKYLSVVTDLDAYHFEDSKFIQLMEAKIKNNTEVQQLMGHIQYGLFGPSSFVSLSENELYYKLRTPGNHDCDNTALVTKIKTVIPAPEYAASPTEKQNKWQIDSNTSLYLNVRFVLPLSRHRKGTTFSKLRPIIANDEVIKNINVYNNTFMFVESTRSFNMSKVCGNDNKKVLFTVFPNPILKVPRDCSLESQFLNVSRYRTIFTTYDVADSEEISSHDDEEFFPVYHEEEDTEIQESEMHEAIHQVFVLRKRLTTLQRSLLENAKTQNSITKWWNSVTDWVHDTVVDIFSDAIKTCGVILTFGLLIIIIGGILYYKCCRKKQQVVQVQRGIA